MNSQDQSDDHIYLSVIAAAYNEADNLPQLLKEIADALAALGQKSEVIIVNDASVDATADILQNLLGRYPQLRILTLRKRAGQTAALDAGLRSAEGRFIATLDADLQNDPADIPLMLELIVSGECDMVNGWRAKRRDTWLRLLSTRIANGVERLLIGEKVHDSACGLKVFRRECIARVKLFDGMHRFLPSLVRMEGYRVMEMPVNHRPRVAGKAKYGVLNRVFKALRDVFAVRWMKRRMLRYQSEEQQR